MKRLALHSRHESLGAVFGERDGWELPLHYGSAAAEHRAVRRTVGLADRSDRGKLKFTGKDRAAFLQGQITNDVNLLSEGRSVYAALLTFKGKMIADMGLVLDNEAILMDLEPSVTDKVHALLSRYVLSANVKIEDITGETAHFTLQGPDATDLLGKVCGERIPPLSEREVIRLNLNRHRPTIVKTAYTGEQGYDIWVPAAGAADIWGLLMQTGHGMGLRPIGYEALESLRIEAGVPRYGADLDEDVFPVEAGLEEKAISYTKGCYTGQEPISRIKHRGQVNRHLTGFIVDDDIAPGRGDKVMKDKEEAGYVTSGVVSPTLEKTIALGYLRREFAREGETVTILHGEKLVPASVAALPFYEGKK